MAVAGGDQDNARRLSLLPTRGRRAAQVPRPEIPGKPQQHTEATAARAKGTSERLEHMPKEPHRQEGTLQPNLPMPLSHAGADEQISGKGHEGGTEQKKTAKALQVRRLAWKLWTLDY